MGFPNLTWGRNEWTEALYQVRVTAAKDKYSGLPMQDLRTLQQALELARTRFEPIYSHTSVGGLEEFAKWSPEKAAMFHALIERSEIPDSTEYRYVLGCFSEEGRKAYQGLTPVEAKKCHEVGKTIYEFRGKTKASFFNTEACLEAVNSSIKNRSS